MPGELSICGVGARGWTNSGLPGFDVGRRVGSPLGIRDDRDPNSSAYFGQMGSAGHSRRWCSYVRGNRDGVAGRLPTFGWDCDVHPFILLVASVLGVPAFVSLGGVALVLFWSADQPIAALPVAHYSLVTNPSLPTLPLFTLAGYFLAEGGAPKRLVRAFYALFGQFRGGPAIVTVLVCALFTSFTGASGVTILALGGLLMPVLLGARYSERDSLGLLTGSGSLGLLLPPCLPLIVYAIVANVPIKQMFLGGIIPAVVMMTATALWGIQRGSASGGAVRQFEWQEARTAMWDAKWELATPVVASIALFSGIATPVEAAAVTAFYAFLTAAVFHRDLSILRDAPRVMVECGLLIGGVLLILGVSLGFTNYLVDAEVPTYAVAWTTQHIHSPIVFLLLLNLFLLVVGCLMEIYPAIVVEVPLLVPLGLAYHIDPVRLGIIFLANMELGYLTPPHWLESLDVFLSIQEVRTGGAAFRLAGGHGDDSGSSIDHVHSGIDDGVTSIVRILNEPAARRS